MDTSGFENIINTIKKDDIKKEDQDLEQNNVSRYSQELLKDYNIDDLSSNVFDNNIHKIDKKNNNIIHSGHRQRARERFLLNPDKTSDYDLLELLLFLVIPRADTKPIAKTLLDKYKTIRNVFNASEEELNNMNVNGQSLKYLFKLMRVFNQRMIKQDLKDKTKITNITDLIEYCKSILGTLQEEEFHIIFLDAQLNLIDEKKFGLEKVAGVSLNFRDIIKDCVDMKASNIVLCHNHPSGNIEPSSEDIETTEKIIDLMQQIDVEVIDHIIIGGEKWFSFKQHNLF